MVDIKTFPRKNVLLLGTIIGVTVGIISGIIINYLISSPVSLQARTLIGYPGELFLRALQILVLPSVIFNVVTGTASLNIKENGRIVARTFLIFLVTSLFNALMGLVLVSIINPGRAESPAFSMAIQEVVVNKTKEQEQYSEGANNTLLDNLMDFGRNIVPDNIFTPLFQTVYTTVVTPSEVIDGANGNGSSETLREKLSYEHSLKPNILGVLMICLVVGSVLSTLKERAVVIIDIAKSFELITRKISTMVIMITPVGVASIICEKVLEFNEMNDSIILGQLGFLILTVTIGIILYHFVFIQLFYYFVTKKNPVMFYLDILPALMTGFAIQSSSSTLPVTLQCLDKKAKLDSRVSHFVVPLGVTMNMDGTALFLPIASVFIAQLSGHTLGPLEYLSVCLSSTMVSIGASGTPSASLTLMFIILHAIGVKDPGNKIKLLYSVDWLLDRLRTTNNILGDCYTAAIIEHLSKDQLESMDVTF